MPGVFDIGLILFAFASLPLVIVAYFAWRALSAWSLRQDVLRELVDLLDLACRRSLPFPEVLEGFAESLADRGADSGFGRFLPGRRGRLTETSERAFAFAAAVRAGGLAQALQGPAITSLVPRPYLDWLRVGYARGSLPRTLETIRDGLRFDRRRRRYMPLLAYVVFALCMAGVMGELSIMISEPVFAGSMNSSDYGFVRAPLFWLPPVLAVGWVIMVLGAVPLGMRSMGSRWTVFDRVPGLRRMRGLRVEANRLRLVECGLRAGLSPLEALEVPAEAGDGASALAAKRVAEGEPLPTVLGVGGAGAHGLALAELIGAGAAERERQHAARGRSLALASLPLGLGIAGVWALQHHYGFFTTYGRLVSGLGSPW